MRLLFVADGRSPTTLSWLRHWLETEHEVHLISTFPCNPPPGLASFHILPVAFSGLVGGQMAVHSAGPRRKSLVGRFRPLLVPLRYLLGPLSLPPHQQRYRTLVASIQPDLVHALRIPFEGMLAAATPAGIPLIVSIWGNDLTLHARGSWWMANLTRGVLRRADGLMADAGRDIRLAREWGLPAGRPTLVVPGAGGIHLEQMTSSKSRTLPEELPEGPIVVNARGQRPGSLRQDIFFQSIPLVLEKVPQAIFVCPSLKGDAEAERWVEKLGIQAQTRLWPPLAEQAQLWSLFNRAQVYVSPSIHDGTPNSLLESMACGCFPVVGNIESLRDWVQNGINGLLVDANSPRALAEAVVTALQNPSLREAAKKENAHIIAERAEYGRCMAMAEAFYRKVLDPKGLKDL